VGLIGSPKMLALNQPMLRTNPEDEAFSSRAAKTSEKTEDLHVF
jgi:hypothetical protein